MLPEKVLWVLKFFVIDPSQGGYTAYFTEFPGIISEGNTLNEAQENLWAATHDILKYYTSGNI